MVFSRWEDVAKDRDTRGTSSMACKERGSHARGVYPTQYASHMECGIALNEVPLTPGPEAASIVDHQSE